MGHAGHGDTQAVDTYMTTQGCAGTHQAWDKTGHRDTWGYARHQDAQGMRSHRAGHGHARGQAGMHRDAWGHGALACTGDMVTAGAEGAAAAVPAWRGAGAHRVSSGSDSGSRVLGFCSIHRNSIKERSAPTEWAPPPVPRAGRPRRGGYDARPMAPASVLSSAQHPGLDPAEANRGSARTPWWGEQGL